MGIQIKWDCNLDRAASLCLPRYSFRRLDTRDQDHNVSPGYNFRWAWAWADGWACVAGDGDWITPQWGHPHPPRPALRQCYGQVGAVCQENAPREAVRLWHPGL